MYFSLKAAIYLGILYYRPVKNASTDDHDHKNPPPPHPNWILQKHFVSSTYEEYLRDYVHLCTSLRFATRSRTNIREDDTCRLAGDS